MAETYATCDLDGIAGSKSTNGSCSSGPRCYSHGVTAISADNGPDPMTRSRLALTLVVASSVSTTAFLAGDKPQTVTAPAIDSVSSPTGPGSAEPNLAVGADGKVFLTWLEPADSGHALRLATLTRDTWSRPVTIRAGRDFFVNWADFPSIEVLDGNRLAVHWLQRTGKSTYAYGVRISQSRDGGRTWSQAVTPHRDTASQEHGFVAMWRERGALGAVWLDGRKFQHDSHDASNEMMLMSTTVAADGKLGPEVQLDDRTCDCCQNAVAMTGGGPIVAYRNRTTDEIRDIYVTRRVNGKWTTGAPVFADGWKIAACPVNGPALAASGNRVALAWFTGAQDTARVKVAFSKDGGATFGAPTRIDGGSPGGRVDALLLADGSALVSWIERIGGDTAAVRVRRVTPDGKSGAAITVAQSSTARASGVPKMVQAGDRVIFAWTVPGKPSTVRVARAKVSALR